MASLTSGPVTGGGSVSSLVKSASTLASEIATFNDTVAANAFANDHSDGAYNTYNDYLSGRIKTLQASGTISNQTKAASLSQTQVSALKANQSFNIQTTTIAVLDGTASPQDKLTAIGNAFQSLYSVGDVNAAQQYESQYYSYSQTLQLQKQQAADALASAAKTAESAYGSAVTAGEDQIKNSIQNANAAFEQFGSGFLDKLSSSYLTQMEAATGGKKVAGVASIFAGIQGQVGALQAGVQMNDTTKYAQGTYTPGSELDLYTQAIIGDPTKAASYKDKIDAIVNGVTTFDLPGGKTVNWNALNNTVMAGNSGNAPYSIAQTGDGQYSVESNHITGYVFGKNQNGQTTLMPAYSFYNTAIPTGANSVGAALVKAGVNVKSDSNNDSWFQATNQASWMAKVLGTGTVQGAVQKDGSIEFAKSDGTLLSLVKGSNGKFGFQEINQFGQVVNANVAGEYGFQPPANQLNVVKGSTAFMSKVLGDTATPQELDGKTVYQANGKLYQLATDTKGLKGLQEIDKNGKVIDSNVAGQYGFNPASLTRGPGDGTPDMKGAQFIQTLANQHEQYMNGLLHADSPGFKNSDGISAFSPGWLGVSALINNAQMINTVNTAHNQAMLAIAPPLQLPKLQLPVAQAPPPSSTPQLKVAGAATIQPTANPQPASSKSTQILQPTTNPQQTGGGFNLNQSGSGGIKLGNL